MELLDRDDTIDALYLEIFNQILEMMAQDPATIYRATRVQSIAKYMERIADHAMNIAEAVVFLVKGKDVRHRNRRAQTSDPPVVAEGRAAERSPLTLNLHCRSRLRNPPRQCSRNGARPRPSDRNARLERRGDARTHSARARRDVCRRDLRRSAGRWRSLRARSANSARFTSSSRTSGAGRHCARGWARRVRAERHKNGRDCPLVTTASGEKIRGAPPERTASSAREWVCP